MEHRRKFPRGVRKRNSTIKNLYSCVKKESFTIKICTLVSERGFMFTNRKHISCIICLCACFTTNPISYLAKQSRCLFSPRSSLVCGRAAGICTICPISPSTRTVSVSGSGSQGDGFPFATHMFPK